MLDVFDPTFGMPGDDTPLEEISARAREQSAAASNVRSLQKQIEQHHLLIEVLVRALVDKGLYTRDQLNALANLVDMEDGVRDGRLTPAKGVRHCENCQRVLQASSGKCLYCGHETVMNLI